MTSEDVKFTFDRATDAVRVGGVRAKFTNIESVSTDGPYTVSFHLKQPDPLFPLGVLSDYDGAVMSKKAIEEKGEEAIGTDPIGTGVYVLETRAHRPVAGRDRWSPTTTTGTRRRSRRSCRSSTSPTPRRARWRSCRATCT